MRLYTKTARSPRSSRRTRRNLALRGRYVRRAYGLKSADNNRPVVGDAFGRPRIALRSHATGFLYYFCIRFSSFSRRREPVDDHDDNDGGGGEKENERETKTRLCFVGRRAAAATVTAYTASEHRSRAHDVRDDDVVERKQWTLIDVAAIKINTASTASGGRPPVGCYIYYYYFVFTPRTTTRRRRRPFIWHWTRYW